jgi:hypothetical protein
MYGYPDTDPNHWGRCDFCDQRKYRGFPRRGLFYCIDCKNIEAVSEDDVIDAHELLKEFSLAATLMRLLGTKVVYFRDP